MTFRFKNVPLHSKAWQRLKKRLDVDARREKKIFTWEIVAQAIDPGHGMMHSETIKKYARNIVLPYTGMRYRIIECASVEAARLLMVEANQGVFHVVQGCLQSANAEDLI